MALLSAMWCDAVSEVEPSGDDPSGAELTRYGPARWHSSETEPPRPPRGGHPSTEGNLTHSIWKNPCVGKRYYCRGSRIKSGMTVVFCFLGGLYYCRDVWPYVSTPTIYHTHIHIPQPLLIKKNKTNPCNPLKYR